MTTEMKTTSETNLSVSQLAFLARLPTLLNSSLDTQQIIRIALRHLKSQLGAEAATVFLRASGSRELMFWALEGGESERLHGKKIPADVGVVGWVTNNQQSVRIADVAKDPRFFGEIDKTGGFRTRSILCVPLLVRGETLIGALEVLNRESGEFLETDQEFTEVFASQLALAIDNARLFQETKMRAHQLATLDRRKQEMLSVLTHEFRTPLTIIQNSAEMLAFGNLAESERETLCQTLQNGLERLSQLVGKIHTTSRVTDEKLEVQLAPISLIKVFQNIETLFADVFIARKLHFQHKVDSPHRVVNADLTLLLVALKNLVSNAIRFTPDGGRIELRARDEATLVEISVQDSGIGIEVTEIPLIFEKFYEVTKATEHSSGNYGFRSNGLGLGLAAVKAILQAHGAEIEVTSSLGQGSCFRFCLPSVQGK